MPGIILSRNKYNNTVGSYNYRTAGPNNNPEAAIAYKPKVTKLFKEQFDQWKSQHQDEFHDKHLGFTYNYAFGVFQCYGRHNYSSYSECYADTSPAFPCQLLQEPKPKDGHQFGGGSTPPLPAQATNGMVEAAIRGVVNALMDQNNTGPFGITNPVTDFVNTTQDRALGVAAAVFGNAGAVVDELLGLNQTLPSAPLSSSPEPQTQWILAAIGENPGDIGDEFPDNPIFGQHDPGSTGGGNFPSMSDYLDRLNSILKALYDHIEFDPNGPKPGQIDFLRKMGELLDIAGTALGAVDLGKNVVTDLLDGITGVPAHVASSVIGSLLSKLKPVFLSMIKELLNTTKDVQTAEETETDNSGDSTDDDTKLDEIFRKYFVNSFDSPDSVPGNIADCVANGSDPEIEFVGIGEFYSV